MFCYVFLYLFGLWLLFWCWFDLWIWLIIFCLRWYFLWCLLWLVVIELYVGCGIGLSRYLRAFYYDIMDRLFLCFCCLFDLLYYGFLCSIFFYVYYWLFWLYLFWWACRFFMWTFLSEHVHLWCFDCWFLYLHGFRLRFLFLEKLWIWSCFNLSCFWYLLLFVLGVMYDFVCVCYIMSERRVLVNLFELLNMFLR